MEEFKMLKVWYKRSGEIRVATVNTLSELVVLGIAHKDIVSIVSL